MGCIQGFKVTHTIKSSHESRKYYVKHAKQTYLCCSLNSLFYQVCLKRFSNWLVFLVLNGFKEILLTINPTLKDAIKNLICVPKRMDSFSLLKTNESKHPLSLDRNETKVVCGFGK